MAQEDNLSLFVYKQLSSSFEPCLRIERCVDGMESPIIKFRAKETLKEELEARAMPDEALSPSLVAQRDLERYYALLPRVLPTFSEAEAYLIVDALNGSLCPSELIHVHWMTIEDAILLDHLDQKWNLDGKQFLARLHQFSPFELIAIRDAAERFWHIVSRKDHPPSDEVLRQVGLVCRSASATLEKAS